MTVNHDGTVQQPEPVSIDVNTILRNVSDHHARTHADLVNQLVMAQQEAVVLRQTIASLRTEIAALRAAQAEVQADEEQPEEVAG